MSSHDKVGGHGSHVSSSVILLLLYSNLSIDPTTLLDQVTKCETVEHLLMIQMGSWSKIMVE